MLSTVCFSHAGYSALLMEASQNCVLGFHDVWFCFVTFITKATPETENHGISTSEEVLNIKNIQQ